MELQPEPAMEPGLRLGLGPGPGPRPEMRPQLGLRMGWREARSPVLPVWHGEKTLRFPVSQPALILMAEPQQLEAPQLWCLSVEWEGAGNWNSEAKILEKG